MPKAAEPIVVTAVVASKPATPALLIFPRTPVNFPRSLFFLKSFIIFIRFANNPVLTIHNYKCNVNINNHNVIKNILCD